MTKYMNNKYTAIIHKNNKLQIGTNTDLAAVVNFDWNQNTSYTFNYDLVLMANDFGMVNTFLTNPHARYLVVAQKQDNVRNEIAKVKPIGYVNYNIVFALYSEDGLISIYTWLPFKIGHKCSKNINPEFLGECEKMSDDPFRYKLEKKLRNCQLEICLHEIFGYLNSCIEKMVNTFGSSFGVKIA